MEMSEDFDENKNNTTRKHPIKKKKTSFVEPGEILERSKK